MRLLSYAIGFIAIVLFTGDVALAADGAPIFGAEYGALAGGLAIGLAAFGGALAQGKATSAALEGIGRNPAASGKMLIPMVLGLVLIESLVIYALVVAFSLTGTA